MNAIYLLLAAATEHGAEGGGGVKAFLNPDLALTGATWLTFFILIGLLKKFGWGPMTKALEDRESKIAESVHRAERARADAEELLMSYNQKLASAQGEADRVINNAREKAEQVAARMADDARKTAEEIVTKAQASIESERQKAVAELRGIVAESAAMLAGNILKEELDPKRHQKLIDNVVIDLPARRKG